MGKKIITLCENGTCDLSTTEVVINNYFDITKFEKINKFNYIDKEFFVNILYKCTSELLSSNIISYQENVSKQNILKYFYENWFRIDYWIYLYYNSLTELLNHIIFDLVSNGYIVLNSKKIKGDILKPIFQKYDIAPNFKLEQSDYIILTGCGHTEEKILKIIKRYDDYIKPLKEKNPNLKVILTGCISKEYSDKFLSLKLVEEMKKEFDYIIDENKIADFLNKINDINTQELNYDELAYEYSGKQEDGLEFVKFIISRGCNNKCTFCKTNFQNFSLKSINYEKLLKNIDSMDELSNVNLMLSGTNVSQYGLDLKNRYLLIDVLKYIEQKDNIKEVYLLGSALKDIIESELDKYLCSTQNTKVKHINFSLESGSSRILKLMNKGVTKEDYLEVAKLLNQNGITIYSLNVIVGFPTETIDDIYETINVISRIKPSSICLCGYNDSSFAISHNYNILPLNQIEKHLEIYRQKLDEIGIPYSVEANSKIIDESIIDYFKTRKLTKK